jgi:hypothetical protein
MVVLLELQAHQDKETLEVAAQAHLENQLITTKVVGVGVLAQLAATVREVVEQEEQEVLAYNLVSAEHLLTMQAAGAAQLTIVLQCPLAA